jgi:hypothetical protein
MCRIRHYRLIHEKDRPPAEFGRGSQERILMKLINETKEVIFPLTEDLINENASSLFEFNGILQYAVAIDFEQCNKKHHIMYQILRDLCIEKFNIPAIFIDTVIEYNDFGLSINIDIKQKKEYFFSIGGRVSDTEFSESFLCEPNFLEYLLLDKYMLMIDEKVKTGQLKVHKYTV